MSKTTLHIAEITKTTYNADVYEPSDVRLLLRPLRTMTLLHPIPAYSLAGQLCSGRCLAAEASKHSSLFSLPIGVGSGYVSCSLACLLKEQGCNAACIATDISPYAVEATKATLAAHQVTSVDVIQADLAWPLFHRLQEAVDVLVFNPPYVPTPDEEVTKGGIAAAWAGGNCGRLVIDQVLPQVKSLLRSGGHFFLVTVPENNPKGSVVLTRRADEEILHILHVTKADPVQA